MGAKFLKYSGCRLSKNSDIFSCFFFPECSEEDLKQMTIESLRRPKEGYPRFLESMKVEITEEMV